MTGRAEAPVDTVETAVYTIPTDEPESDGTLEWDSTTMVVVHTAAAGQRGFGYTYGSSAVATLIGSKLGDVVRGRDAFDIGAAWTAMGAAIRNVGRAGVGMMAVAALDISLWDLKAKLLGVPLVDALPAFHRSVPIYGSGGFTSYSLSRLREQLGGWVEQGIPRVKMKFGRHPDRDPARLDAAREAIGDGAALFVDANGAFDIRTAVGWSHRLKDEWDVHWFEEPVTSEDPEGLCFVRDHSPGGIDIAAGEYGWVLSDFRGLLEPRAVDCLQADVTRCGGITGLLQVAGMADGLGVDISGHCAPALSARALCGVRRLRHLEYFHDHVRIEHMLLDGMLDPEGGQLSPDRDRPGLGLELKESDAAKYRQGGSR